MFSFEGFLAGGLCTVTCYMGIIINYFWGCPTTPPENWHGTWKSPMSKRTNIFQTSMFDFFRGCPTSTSTPWASFASVFPVDIEESSLPIGCMYDKSTILWAMVLPHQFTLAQTGHIPEVEHVRPPKILSLRSKCYNLCCDFLLGHKKPISWKSAPSSLASVVLYEPLRWVPLAKTGPTS